MKLVKTANGKQQVKLSRKEWKSIEEKNGWMKEAQYPNLGGGDDVDSNNPMWITKQLRTYISNPDTFWSNMELQTGEIYNSSSSKYKLLKELLTKLKQESPTLEMLTKEEQKNIARGIIAIKTNIDYEDDLGIEENRGAPSDTMVETPPNEGQNAEEGAEENSFELDESEFATPRQIGDIKDQLLDRYRAREITEEQLKNMLNEFAKKHNLNIKLARSNGKLQVRIGKRKTAQFEREIDDSRKEKALMGYEKESKERKTLDDLSHAKLVSDCCKEKDKTMGIDGPSYSSLKICPKCKSHCEFGDS